MKYFLYKCSGEVESIVVENPLPIEQLKHLVGGDIEPIYLGESILLTNVDGRVLGKPPNPTLMQNRKVSGYEIVGDALAAVLHFNTETQCSEMWGFPNDAERPF